MPCGLVVSLTQTWNEGFSQWSQNLKLLTKMLANRLAPFTKTYIHKDKVGFIPGRQGPDQVSRAVDLISILQ